MSIANDFFEHTSDAPSVSSSVYSKNRFEIILTAIARFAPVYDWVSFAIIQWMMVNVGWSVMLAGWGDLPSVIPALVLGTIAAFIGAKLNLNIYFKVVYALGLGFLVVIWRGTTQGSGTNVFERAYDGILRFSIWVETAQNGGISTDTVPFALMFMTAAWLVGYGVTALTFRFNSPWLPTVLLSLVILTNLSYRHGQHEHTYFLFLVGGIALFAHLTTVKRIQRWTAQGIGYSRSLAWAAVQDGLLFALPIVLLSAFLPVWEPRSVEIQKTWHLLRAPFFALQDPANRLLAGVDGPGSNKLFSTPSQTMAFGGSINLTEEPLMWVKSKYVIPHAGRVYQTYTPQGWLTDLNTITDADPRTALMPVITDLARERVSVDYVPLVDTRTVVPSGAVFSVDRETEVQVLNPIEWPIELSGSANDLGELPPDINLIASSIRLAINELVPVEYFLPPELVRKVLRVMVTADTTGKEQVLTRVVINDDGSEETFETVLSPLSSGEEAIDWTTIVFELETDSNSGRANKVFVGRLSPIEQVGVVLSEEIPKENSFSIQTFVTLATDEQLNEAGTAHPKWISDRYLQLPTTLSPEIQDLALQIVRDAEADTPFEKAEAIKVFLQDQEYSLEIEGPEFGVDGLFYFLFQTPNEACASVNPDCDATKIKGYSQYFGSAAAVLLRTVDVPARFVAGWSPGEYISDAEMFLVRDRHRHGWTQVYFPDYGWIDYEVTPGMLDVDRGQLLPLPDIIDPFSAGSIGSAEEDLQFLDDIADLERLAREARGAGGGSGSNSGDEPLDQTTLPLWPIIWFVIFASGPILAMFLWWLSLRRLSAPSRAYERMTRIGWMLGMKRLPNETSLEFAFRLGRYKSSVMEPAIYIATEYQQSIYGGPKRSDPQPDGYENSLDSAWRKLAKALIVQRLMRFGSIGA